MRTQNSSMQRANEKRGRQSNKGIEATLTNRRCRVAMKDYQDRILKS